MENRRIFDRVVMLIAIAAIVFGGYFYYEWSKLKKDPQASTQAEVSELVSKVSKLIVLPTDEVPTVATVSDPEALQSQPFFAKAVVGDKVLIYTTAKKAILYSVSMNKILEVAPLNIGNQSTGENTTPVTPSGTSSTDLE